MSKLSLLEKFTILVNLIKESKVLFWLFIGFIVIGILLSIVNSKNKKIGKIVYIIGLLSILVYLGISYSSSLLKMFEYMMDNFFIAIYFPTFAIYFAAIIIMNIIVWVSVIKDKSSKEIKIVNTVSYFIMNYLLILICTVIHKEKLDVFSQSSIYQNEQARALIELSSTFFIIWMIYLIIYKLILTYLKSGKKKNNIKNTNLSVAYRNMTIPEYKVSGHQFEEYQFEDNKEKDYIIINNPEVVKGSKKKNNYEILNTPSIVYKDEVKKEEKDYTITDIPEIVNGKGIKKPSNYQLLNTPSIVYKDEVKKEEKEYEPLNMPKYIYGKGKKKKQIEPVTTPLKVFRKLFGTEVKKPIAQKIVLPEKEDKIINNVEIPSTVYAKAIKKPEETNVLNDSSFTLEDYKLFSEILKNHKKQTKDNGKYQAIDNKKSEEIYGSLEDILWNQKPTPNISIEELDKKVREEQKKDIIKIEKERRSLLEKELKKQQKQEEKEIKQEQITRNKILDQREYDKMTEIERLYQGINI